LRLLIHADSLSYRVTGKAIEQAEPIGQREASFNECLVAFCAVEEVDEADVGSAARAAADAIEDVARRVGSQLIVVYPYAHLSSRLARPSVAVEALKALEAELRGRGLTVHRAPFGWYKAFTLSCKGHPLSELSRAVEPVQARPVKVEEGRPSKLIVLEPSGEEHELKAEDLDSIKPLKEDPLLRQLALNELGVGGGVGEAPPHVKLMVKLGLVDYEPASDVGHFRFYPKGALLKDLLERLANDLAVRELGALKIETPMIYRLSERAIAEQASRFRERDYRFRVGGEEFALRFAGDFGLFSMMRGATVSYRHLPLRVYELSKSFRLEQSGECVGLKRLRGFTMPDVHCFCRDLAQGMEEYRRLFEVYTKLAEGMGVGFAVAFRAEESFYRENKQWFLDMLRSIGRPALIELLPERKRKHYWVVKHEYQFIDSVGGNAQLCTVQLDVEDSERYGIYYVDESSSMGSIERWIYALLEEAARMMRQGRPPMLPTWLSPTQVRVIPVSSDYLGHALKVADQIERASIRVDVDDRDESVAKKVRDAETEWIPYIAVVGQREVEGGFITVRVRRDRSVREMKVEELIEAINAEIGDKPRLPLYEPKLVSLRPRFT